MPERTTSPAQDDLGPLNGSPLAERVLPYTGRLARGADRRLVLLRVVGRDAPNAGADLDAVADRLRGEGAAVERYVVTSSDHGEVAGAIAAIAHDRGADLIAMSTHGRGGLGRWLYGSVADRVLRDADVPVLLVSAICERSRPNDRPLRLLVSLDGSAVSEAALAAADTLIAGVVGERLLVTVINPMSLSFPEMGPPRPLPSPLGPPDRSSSRRAGSPDTCRPLSLSVSRYAAAFGLTQDERAFASP